MKTKHQARRKGAAKVRSAQAGVAGVAGKTVRCMNSYEFRVMALREYPLPEEMHVCMSPEAIADYWQACVVKSPQYNPARECMTVVLLNTRRRVIGHEFVSSGTRDTVVCDATGIFRTAVIADAAAVVMLHNHPSGDPDPSETDIKITRIMIQGGKLLSIEICDHLVMGRPTKKFPKGYASLRELGYFY